jgi:hypothetical protein
MYLSIAADPMHTTFAALVTAAWYTRQCLTAMQALAMSMVFCVSLWKKRKKPTSYPNEK